MDTNFKKLQVRSFPNTIEKEDTDDSNYWKHLKVTFLLRQFNFVRKFKKKFFFM